MVRLFHWPCRLLKEVSQRGRKPEITGGVPSGDVEDALKARTQLGGLFQQPVWIFKIF